MQAAAAFARAAAANMGGLVPQLESQLLAMQAQVQAHVQAQALLGGDPDAAGDAAAAAAIGGGNGAGPAPGIAGEPSGAGPTGDYGGGGGGGEYDAAAAAEAGGGGASGADGCGACYCYVCFQREPGWELQHVHEAACSRAYLKRWGPASGGVPRWQCCACSAAELKRRRRSAACGRARPCANHGASPCEDLFWVQAPGCPGRQQRRA